jgi:hypothetical protein
MAGTARTPTSTVLESLGSMRLHISAFTAVDDTDTYASGHVNSIVMAWFNPTDVPTGATYEGVDVTYTLSTGAIVFNCGEDDRAGNLYILTCRDGLNS